MKKLILTSLIALAAFTAEARPNPAKALLGGGGSAFSNDSFFDSKPLGSTTNSARPAAPAANPALGGGNPFGASAFSKKQFEADSRCPNALIYEPMGNAPYQVGSVISANINGMSRNYTVTSAGPGYFCVK